MEENALLTGEPGGERGDGALQRNCRERWLVLFLIILLVEIALLEEIGGATTTTELMSDGVVGTEILISVEAGYLVKRAHEIWGQRQ